MTERTEIARSAAKGLRRFADQVEQTPVLVGFDGFVDSIIHVVDQRPTREEYVSIKTIEAFGGRISAAAGRSANFEMVTTRQKLGGNGPIMANAMASAGLAVTYVGAVGEDRPHPVFAELARHAEVHPIAPPGYTDALEFADGKLMLGKYEHLGQLSYQRIRQTLGEDRFAGMLSRSHLLGMVNWTMLTGIQTIWEALEQRLLPKVEPWGEGRRLLFVDLADPEKRTREDLIQALHTCSRLNAQVDVILGLNLKESGQVLRALGLNEPAAPESAIESTARTIREHLDLHGVVVHPRRGAAAAMKERGGRGGAAVFHGPFVCEPRLSTGAGDNFNAGFCLGRLAGLEVAQALCAGTATSGYYVRHAASPTLDQLADFCDALPEPEEQGT